MMTFLSIYLGVLVFSFIFKKYIKRFSLTMPNSSKDIQGQEGLKESMQTERRIPSLLKTPKNFRIGNDVQPKRDLSRYVRWPRYILLHRQKKILLQRIKVPAAIHQFSKTLDKNQSSKVYALLKKYAPETKTEKKQRLVKAAESKAQNQKTDSKKVTVLKFGLNHVTTLVETKKAKLVLIAYDVDPIELVVWLPQLCRRQEVPFAFVKNKARLGALVHQKTATCVALTDVRKEDQAEFDNLARDLRQHYNENHELLRTIGGGQVGIKSRHQQEAIKKAFELEELKKTSQ
ncbi:unnamed protein product (macronuclear) [Paramecium tetraurelia]|uniref:60S ribosomal protein L7a n=1 Tax=Paramecium tetraurelia TaxID=5888 RepID=A0CYP1_PARTE|nr:uncharacterized protein GSPATT00011509001 [Paramecium tetraurelia]CAK75908.1 unnamed protein product [Paramecium tetraurelia]|eukprot:XP_001443305.1 hypothetical protein (macronuclear) [Paramecium tetraurelia strain d4-2]